MILLALLAAAGPLTGELKTFRDWTVGCDNGRACQAVGLMPADDNDGFATMAVSRGGQPQAPPVISIDADDMGVAAILIGRRRIALGKNGGVALRDVPAVIGVMRTGKALILGDASGKEVARVSLDGARAALLYIDDRQHRIGTVTALARPGAKPATSMPTPPALPVVTMPPSSPKPADVLGDADARRFAGDGDCGIVSSDYQPESHRLDARTTLVLVPQPCDNGAYNYMSVAVTIQGGKARLADFDTPRGMDGETLVNAGWDDKTRLLSSFAKARGLGDCGSMQDFAWDGARFRLVSQKDMDECRGSVDYIPTWSARVVQR